MRQNIKLKLTTKSQIEFGSTLVPEGLLKDSFIENVHKNVSNIGELTRYSGAAYQSGAALGSEIVR